MPCYHPLKGYYSREKNPSGKRSIVFNRAKGFADRELELPCGQCIGCRLERSRQWAIRCMHESQMYDHNCFLTLTYNDQNLPPDNSLNVRDFQLFMKRLRKRFGRQIRFFHCGEYGEKFQRPHYHACIFNFDFPDKKLHSERDGNKVYTSAFLQELWQDKGFCLIGDVTFESAAYVARYITKKITGPNAIHHYNEIDYSTGEIKKERKPEYVTMSRRPGIGKPWFDKFHADVFNHDYAIINGKKVKPPKYYDSQFELVYPHEMAKIKGSRVKNAQRFAENTTQDRLNTREECQHERMSRLPRNFEK